MICGYPPRGSIGIIELGENLKVIYWAQLVMSKILSRKDLEDFCRAACGPLSPCDDLLFRQSGARADVTKKLRRLWISRRLGICLKSLSRRGCTSSVHRDRVQLPGSLSKMLEP
jgi:hypothetical protein